MKSGQIFRNAFVIIALFTLSVSPYAWSLTPANGDDFRVTLLGTGSPQSVMNRFGPGVLCRPAVRRCFSIVGVVSHNVCIN